MDKTGRLIARIVGAVSLAFGIAAAILTVWAVDRQFAIRGVVQISAAVAVVVYLSISGFCCLTGFRLMFNRPNRNGWLLSSSRWKWLALCFWSVGLTLAAIGLGRGKYQLLGAAITLSVLGLGSALALKVASSKLSWSPVLPLDTSLLGMKGFVPSGFSCGLEIMNDNLTPMAFVVSVLQTCLDLSETDAIRTMLEIHRKGGVLFPLASFEEARRVADLVTDGQPIGVQLLDRPGTHIQLVQLYIAKKFQRRGFGTLLLKRLIEEASASKLPIRLRVLAVNPAKALYERMGFVVVKGTPERYFMEWRP